MKKKSDWRRERERERERDRERGRERERETMGNEAASIVEAKGTHFGLKDVEAAR